MTRIVKEYQERKLEFLEATKSFLFTIGYEKMSVAMLTQKIGVAKGTFYHYFSSKEDLLSQWVLHEMMINIQQHNDIAKDPGLGAIEKLNKIFAQGREYKLINIDMMVSLLKVLYDDNNLRLRAEMLKQSRKVSAPMLSLIIKQGIDEGVFHSRNHDLLAEKLIQIMQLFSQDFGQDMITHLHEGGVRYSHFKSTIDIWQDIIEKILGAPSGSVIFVTDHFLKSYYNHISSKEKVIS